MVTVLEFEKLGEMFASIFSVLDDMKHRQELDEINYIHMCQTLSRCMMMFHLIDRGESVLEY